MKYVVKVDDFELSEDEYMAVQDNELSLFDVLDNRFTNDRLNIYIKDFQQASQISVTIPVVLQACGLYNGRIRQIHFPFTMNSGTTSTELNDMLTDFVEYVYSFYGADDALYPMGVTKAEIYGATYDYLNAVTKINDDRFTWGDGDSLDRERVRDFLVRNYGYSTDFDGGSLWIFDGTSLEEAN